MEYRAAVITMSDKGSQGLRKDTAGDAVVEILDVYKRQAKGSKSLCSSCSIVLSSTAAPL